VDGGVEAVNARREIHRRDLEHDARPSREGLGHQAVRLGVDAEHRDPGDGRDPDAEDEVGERVRGLDGELDGGGLPRPEPPGLPPRGVEQPDALEPGPSRADPRTGAARGGRSEARPRFFRGDALSVSRDGLGGGGVRGDAPALEPDRAAAARRDEGKVVRDEEERLAGPLELRELLEAPVGEGLVADRQHFVHQEHVRVAVRRHGEAETDRHARRVRLDRRVQEILDAGETRDRREPRRHFLLRQSEEQARHLPTFSRPEISGWNPAPSSRSAASLPSTQTRPDVGRTIPARSFKSVDFPDPFGPITPTVSPASTPKETSVNAGTNSSRRPSPSAGRERSADLRDPPRRRRSARR
jgi:hypothetical protein